MVLEVQVNDPVLVIHPSLLSVLAEECILLCGRRPCWDVCRVDRVGREDKCGSGYAYILFGREDESKVAVFASAKVALDGRRIFRQELMCLLDGGLVWLAEVLGE